MRDQSIELKPLETATENWAPVHLSVARSAAATPAAIAVEFQHASMTYAELDARANGVAHALVAQGIGPNSVVAVGLERSIDLIVAILGVLKAGAAYLPLDPAYPDDRRAFMLSDSRAHALIAETRTPSASPSTGVGADIFVLDLKAVPSVAQAPDVAVGPDDLAYVIYTSGSTGRPKGVAMPHGPLARLIAWQIGDSSAGAGTRTLQFTSVSFDVSFQEIFSTLATGGALVLVSEQTRRDPRALLRLIRERGIARIFLPFVALQQLAVSGAADEPVPSLREVVTAGEQLRVTPAMIDWFGRHPGCSLHNHYGPAETHVVTAYRLEGPAAHWPRLPPIGAPLPHVEIRLLDEAGQPAPDTGEVFIGGDCLALGYLHRPDLTAERFVPDPTKPGRKLYRTGDLARWQPGGVLEFLGRADDQVKIRGYRIEPSEIETVLLQHPTVREVAIAAHDDGNSNRRLTAYVVPFDDDEALAQDAARQVSNWQTVWEDTYEQQPLWNDPTLAAQGWRSSYSGTPYTQDEMREWADATASRVLARKPTSVLELGCGTGMLLSRIAPATTTYWASDVSPRAVAYVRRHAAQWASHVKLLTREAADFTDIPDGMFDAVILNSVAQNLPSVDYLVTVLRKAARAVRPGGFVFVGDMPHLGLLDVFHTSVELGRAPETWSLTELRQRIQRQVMLERELVLDPAFFSALRDVVPAFGVPEILLRRGLAHTEMNAFRYDTVLPVGAGQAAAVATYVEFDDARLDDLFQRESSSGSLVVRGIPNARLSASARAVSTLRRSGSLATVGELRAALADGASDGHHPDQIRRRAEAAGFVADCTWNQRDPTKFDVVCRAGLDRTATSAAAVAPRGVPEGLHVLRGYATNPLRDVVAQRLTPTWRAFLQDRLPDFMVPSAFRVVDRLPLTPSGKVDRRALPAPDVARVSAVNTAPPQTEIERRIAEIWQELLQVSAVGLHDNFFDLGGHSLLLAQAYERIRALVPGRSWSMMDMFQYPTLHGLAGFLTAGNVDTPSTLSSAQDRGRRQREELARRRMPSRSAR